MIYHTPETISGKPNFLFSSNCKIKQAHICTLVVEWTLIVKKKVKNKKATQLVTRMSVFPFETC